MLKLLSAILTLLLAIAPSHMKAQEVEWSVDASVLFNNREGGDGFTPDQTFLFTRLAPEAGLSMLEGEHQLRGGVVWYQPMTEDQSGYKVIPTLYYRWNSRAGWHVAAGIMPRSLMIERMPRYLWSDSLGYCQPNLRGAIVQLSKRAGYAEVALDWHQMQTERDREAFSVMLNADWRVAGPLSMGGHLQYNHLAMSRSHVEGEHVNDDLLINPMATLNFHRSTGLDSLRLSAGAIIAMDRDRGNEHWVNHAGIVATASMRWKRLQIDENFFAGKDIMPLYPAFGSKLNRGDPYYRNKVCSRTDVGVHIVSNRFADLSASVALHAAQHTTGFWQQLSCRFYIDNRLWKRRHDKAYLNGGHLDPLY